MRLLLTRLHLSLLLIFFHLYGWGQVHHYLRFQKIEGLSQNTVFKISQDKQGFLWIGTGDGLNRYDGIGFKVYKPSLTIMDGFITGRVIRNRVVENDSGSLWLSTESGLQYFDKKRNRFHFLVPFNNTLDYLNGLSYPIKEIKGTFWFGKIISGILSYNLQTKQYHLYPFPGVDTNPLKYLADKALYDDNGNIWICQQAGLFCFNIDTKKWTVFLENNNLSIYSCLTGENLYVATTDGILLFNIKTHSSRLIKTATPQNKFSCITKDQYNNIWTGDLSGNIFKINNTADSIVYIGNINGSDGNIFPVYDLFFDESDILWIGTDGMGLLKADIHAPDFNIFPEKEKKENIFIKSIYEDHDGIIWLGTFGHGILQLNKITHTVTAFNKIAFNKETNIINMVSFMKEDQFQNLWIGYGSNLYCRKKNSALFTRIEIPVTENRSRLRVTGMTAFKDQWVITTTTGDFVLPITKDLKNIKLTPEPVLGNFSFLFHIGKDQYLLGSSEAGLFLFTEENGKWQYKKDLIIKMGFKCMYKDSARNFLWFGTDKGLMVFNPENETYKLFTEEDGLGNGYVYSILESGGELWLSTNGGLCNVKIITKNKNGFPDISCRNYKQKDGLQADEFNTGAFLKDRDGLLYFAGINGVNWFNPKSISPDKKISHLAITQFLVNNLPADTTLSPEYIKNLVLSYAQNNIYLQFRALEFSNPATINYAYKLSGWDKDWIYSKTNNEVRYNNLPPGDYVFYVKACNDDGVWMNEPYAVNISILPPFWKRWWFYLLGFFLVTGIVVWITRGITQLKLKKEIEKLERLKALSSERMRISQEMHDDIGSGLTQINLISESAKLHSLPGSNIKNELDDISSTSRQLVDNIGEIIWALNPQHDTLDILLAHLREQLHKLLEYSAIGYSINFPDELPLIELNNQQRRNILLVAKEIVHNSIKHSQGKIIVITVVLQNKELLFDICDDGIGFDPALINNGNGLRNIRQRIDEVGGSIDIRSGQGNGARFVYSFPLL